MCYINKTHMKNAYTHTELISTLHQFCIELLLYVVRCITFIYNLPISFDMTCNLFYIFIWIKLNRAQ